GIWLIDSQTRTTFVNASLTRMFGYSAAEMEGRVLTDFMYEEWAPLVEARIRDPRDGIAEKHEFKFRRKDGSPLWTLMGCTPFVLHGNYGDALGMVTDISNIKALEEQVNCQMQQLKEADRRKDEFLAQLAHELRNPLAPLSLAAHMLQEGGLRPDQVAWCHAAIARQTRHLTRLVDDLLEVSRVSRGLITLDQQVLDIGDLIERCLEISRPRIDAGHHQLALQLPPEPLWVEGDAVRLAQVLSNLLNNAAKFTPSGGHIGLTVEASDTAVTLRITDNGVGIEPAALQRVFGLFEQMNPSAATSNDGLGIGLHLARHLVTLHGGRLDAFSAGLGQGSEFTVCLPRYQGSQEKMTVKTVSRHYSHQRVLVVDDNHDAGSALAQLLELMGCEVRLAADGYEAITITQTFQPQLMFLDIGMPGMDGYDTCRQIRTLSGGSAIHIIALSGWDQDDDRQKSAAAGFDQHFAKPLALDDLEQVLASQR
ncbi:MAG: ATP-binding protein, partial [Methylococcaceae bacterium]